MNSIQKYSCFFVFFIFSYCYANPTDNILLQKGWAALVKDNENVAFRYFWLANEKANKEKNTADKAESLLYLGICSFGSSLEKGLQFATKSLDEFKKLENSNANQSSIGRSKCLQLISTIYSRQNKIKDAIIMSQEVVRILKNKSDTSGTLGLAYISLGSLNEIEKRKDSVEIYYQLALKDFEKHKNLAYLPNAYLKIGKIAQHKNQKEISLLNFIKSFQIANISENKQAKVSCLLAIGKWHSDMEHNNSKAENYYNQAHQIAEPDYVYDGNVQFKYAETPVIYTSSETPLWMYISFSMGTIENATFGTKIIIDNVRVNNSALTNTTFQTSEFTVYPTVTNQFINIAKRKSTPNWDYDFRILSIDGKLMSQQSTTFSESSLFTIDVSQLVKGIYFIQSEGFTSKFIKE